VRRCLSPRAQLGTCTIAHLPTVAPMYAPYSATLPLEFAASTTTTPRTGKCTGTAAAPGYTSATCASPIDILIANAANVNFTLTP
jgi:hypothetical protein